MEIPKKAQGRPPGSRFAITGESRIFKCAKAKCTRREQKNICCAVRAWAKKAGEKVTCRYVPGAVEVYVVSSPETYGHVITGTTTMSSLQGRKTTHCFKHNDSARTITSGEIIWEEK